MRKGYQPIESDSVDLLVNYPRNNIFTVAVMHWLVQELRVALAGQLDEIQIDVIKLVHHYPENKYPWIGIHYENPSNHPDMEPLVRATADRLLEGATLLDFMQYISNSGTDWNAVTDALMADH